MARSFQDLIDEMEQERYMLSMRTGSLVSLVMILTLCVAVSAQQAATAHAPDQAKATPAAPAPESRYVEITGFKTKIFEVKNGDPERFHSLLSGLTSGFKGADVRVQPEFGTITVRDFPENLAAMEEALKRLDRPQPPRPSLELHIHILIASDTAAAGSQEYPAEIADAVKQLQATLRYKTYSLVASGMQRAREERNGIRNSGAIGIGVDSSNTVVWGNPGAPGLRQASAQFNYEMRPISIEPGTSGKASIQIGEFGFHMSWPGGNVGFSNPLTLRDGEKLVVGTTTIGNGAVVVVVTGKILN
jgi:hypothetical protein